MAAEQQTPIDEFSGIPLPLSPQYMSERTSRFSSDEHHAWHNRKDPLLSDLGGKALRGSRIQKANYEAHHIDYHGYFTGPPLPDNDEERLRPIVLAAAGYIPEQAIAFTSRRSPVIVDLPQETREKMREAEVIRVERRADIQQFLKEYVLKQDLSNINESTVDEFLSTKNRERRWILGNDLLGRAARMATEPVSPFYIQAYKNEQIAKEKGQTVSRFVLHSLGMRRHRPRILSELRSRLAIAS